MADVEANVGVMTDFAGGDGETITFKVNPQVRGCQLVSEGFDFEDATVTARPIGTADYVAVATTGMNKTCAISDERRLIMFDRVRIGGLTASSYKVGAFQ